MRLTETEAGKERKEGKRLKMEKTSRTKEEQQTEKEGDASHPTDAGAHTKLVRTTPTRHINAEPSSNLQPEQSDTAN